MKYVMLGGGGFSTENYASPLDRFILSLAGSTRPRICFLPTASGDSKDYIERFYRAFSGVSCEPSDLQLFKRSVDKLDEFIQAQDILYVGGGNTVNMLAVWERHGLLPVIDRFLSTGKVVAGISAGAACWFSWCLSDSFKKLDVVDCLGYVDAGFCPHYDSEPERQLLFSAIVGQKEGIAYAVEDGVALFFVDGKLERVICEQKQAQAYRISPAGDSVDVTPLRPEYLT